MQVDQKFESVINQVTKELKVDEKALSNSDVIDGLPAFSKQLQIRKAGNKVQGHSKVFVSKIDGVKIVAICMDCGISIEYVVNATTGKVQCRCLVCHAASVV